MGFKAMNHYGKKFSNFEISKERAFKFLTLRFKTTTISQNVFQVMKYQRRKPYKFWL